MKTKRRKSIKTKAAGLIIASLLAIAGFILIPFIQQQLPDKSGGEVQADIPAIRDTNEDGYIYQYEGATFDVLMGEKYQNPIIKVKQGLRTLDITVVSQYVPGVQLNTQTEEITPSPSTTPDITPTPSIIPSPSPEVTPTDTPTLDPAEQPTEQTSLNQEPDSQENDTNPITRIFNLWNYANANEQIKVINEESSPAVEYSDNGFILTPTLDKVTLTFDILSGEELPTLKIQTEQLTVTSNQEKITFQTRTNRKAFELANATVTDGAGVTGKATLNIEENEESNQYEISITPEDNWLNEDRVYPATLEIELVSLFHDRMLPIRPLKKDFKATDKLEFEVDVGSITDESVRSAFDSEDLSTLNFGLIDSAGETKPLTATTKERIGDTLTLELSTNEPVITTGLFDLLIQKGDDPAFISEEDFSWGVLAINPNQAVYEEGDTARIDMAVLDPLGKVICDANLTLDITDPTVNIVTLSTSAGEIDVTEGCVDTQTTMADYTTIYDTGDTGIYTLSLTAETDLGDFTIVDSFTVDPNQPFYIKRNGPTRIFPLKTYHMIMEVKAKEHYKGTVTEQLPADFEILATSQSTVQRTESDPNVILAPGIQLVQEVAVLPIEENHEAQVTEEGKTTTLIWAVDWEKDKEYQLAYTFDAPDISPALFLLGPLTIGNYQELRQWQIASDAITTPPEQTATGQTAGGTTVSASFVGEPTDNNLLIAIFGSAGSASALDITTPTSGHFLSAIDATGTPAQGIFYDIADSGTTEITITGTADSARLGMHIYEYAGADTNKGSVFDANGSGTGSDGTAECSVSTSSTNELVIFGVTVNGNVNDAAFFSDWTAGADDFTERNDFQNTGTPGSRSQYGGGDHIAATANSVDGVATFDTAAAWRCQMAAFFEATSSDPVTADLMRHGNYFQSNIEQSFFWAN